MTLNDFNEKLKALDPRFSVVKKQFRRHDERPLNDKDIDEHAKRSITLLKNELEHDYVWPLTLSLFMLLQSLISNGSYSGEGNGPKFGDYEAQRHWMEITVNLPVHEWYFNTSNNDLNYWGIDYPPLTAYHSYLFGKIAGFVDKEWVALHSSRGYESPEHKLFMRLSVILTMLLLYAPATKSIYQYWYRKKKRPVLLFSILCYPGLLYVDGGHFQYNHISLALCLWSFKFFCTDRIFIGSILFVLALSFKQMSLYFALPVFIFLLFRSFRGDFFSGCLNVSKLGLVVILTFVVIWLPFLTPIQFPQVLHRIFPVARGLFEDKVATFWCAVSPVYKFQLLPMTYMLKISSVVVLIGCIPTLFLLARRPTEKNFGYSLFLCSLSFFLFSIQVHEKTILFVSIPAFLLLDDHPEMMTTFLFGSLFSMFPLSVEDKLSQMYPIFIAYYLILLVKLVSNITFLSKTIHASNITITSLLAVVHLVCEPPRRFPYLFTLLIAEYSFAIFVLTFLYVYYKNIKLNWITTTSMKKKS